MYIALDEHNEIVEISESIPGKNYYCPACKEIVVAKRGEIRQHYFAHKAGSNCSDGWDKYYDMSEWHKNWQLSFPKINREVVLSFGKLIHRADILVGKTVIEFQHSSISVDLFNKRNEYYRNMGYKVIWLFDLIEDYQNDKLIEESDLNFIWTNPRTTFNNYDLENGQIELFFQLKENDKCIIKVKNSSDEGFKEFSGSEWYLKDEFLEYFKCMDGSYPKPVTEYNTINDEYINFKKKYNINLDLQQERAVQTIDGATLVLSVPGSGKTTVLVNRIGYMINCKHIDGKSILALTYTKMAAVDMKKRYSSIYGDDINVDFRTINSFADEFIRRYGIDRVVISENDKEGILRSIYKEYYDGWMSSTDILEASTTISYIKNMMLNEKEIREYLIWNIDALEIYKKYQNKLDSMNAGFNKKYIDFDDQLVLTYNYLKEDEKALENIQSIYKYFCIDEAQDTSKIQYEIIKLLASKSKNIFMVGDEDQSIYGFRAAYPEALINFKNEYANPFILKIETNYRSTPEIINLASKVISKNKNRIPKKMIPYRENGNKPECIVVNNRGEQYKKILSIIESTNSQITLLYRENICSIPIINDLINKGIKFNIKKIKENFFFNDHIVRDIVAFFRFSLNQELDNFGSIVNKLGFYIKKKDINGICNKCKWSRKSIYYAMKEWLDYDNRDDGYKADELKKIMNKVKLSNPSDAIEILCANGYGDYIKENNYNSSIIEILMYLADEDNDILSFLKHIDKLQKGISDLKYESDAKILLSTVHSSKGLEFDKVILYDLFDGVFPELCKGTEEEKIAKEEEERRLLYVAVTRAKNNF